MSDVTDRLTSLSEQKQKLFSQLRADRARAPAGVTLSPRPPGSGALPLAAAQRGLWFLSRLAPDSAFYHMPYAVLLTGRLDHAALAQAFNALVERHEALRTTFPESGGKPVQRIAPQLTMPLPLTDLSHLPAETREAEAVRLASDQALRPFDLTTGPLFRAGLYRLAAEEHLLMFAMHHIICDGWSIGVMMQELSVFYEAFRHGLPNPLPPLTLHYADYALWQEGWLASGALDGQLDYWRRKLDRVVPLALPTDLPRPAVQRFRGTNEPLAVTSDLTTALEELGRREGATLFMVVLAAFKAVLFLASGTRRIVVGTPIANRTPRETEPMVGFFANTLALATDCSGDPSFRELLARTRDTTLEAFAHQDVPFEMLVEAVQAERDPSRNPLFQVMFGLQSISVRDFGLPGLAASPRSLENETTHFDLELQLWQHGDHLSGYVSYNLDLFERHSAERLIARLQALLAAVVADPGATLSTLAVQAGIPLLAPPPAAEAEAALLGQSSVDDAAVLLRDQGDRLEMAAYVVPHNGFDPDGLRRSLPPALAPVVIIPVSTIPRLGDGTVDQATLAALPAIEPALSERWRQGLVAAEGNRPLRVTVSDYQPPRPWLHLADLLPAPPLLEAALPPLVTPTPGAVATVPALADGGPLELPADAPRTLSAALLRTAAERPEQGIVFVLENGDRRFMPYPELVVAARRILAGLQAQGLKPGDRVILQLANLPDHFSTFWACVLGGIIPVTTALPPSYREKSGVLSKLWNVWSLLHHPVVLTSQSLAAKLAGVPAVYDSAEPEAFRVWSIEELRRPEDEAQLHPADPEEVVFLQLTSGSTGVPKCVQETHRAIVHHIHGSARFNGVGPEHTNLNWLPLDHVVPILTCHLRDTYLGMRQIQVTTSVVLTEPLRWLDLIEEYHVTHSWSPNFGFKLVSDRVLRSPERRWDLSSIKVFMNAGEQVTLPVVEEFLRLLSPFGLAGDVMQPAFGMAEVSTCMTYHNGFGAKGGVVRVRKASLGGPLQLVEDQDGAAPDTTDSISFVDLGPPMPGVQIRITDGDNQLVPERVIGRFQIRGRVVMPGYLDNPKANAEAFVGDGWFDSGDLGFIHQGRLVMTGRAKETIIIRGANFYCHEIEEVVSGVDGVMPTFSAACAVQVPQKGTEGLAVFYVPRSGSLPADPVVGQKIREQVARQLGIAPDFVVPLAQGDFPKTTSGKIQRTQLKQALEAGQFAAALKTLDLAERNANCLPDWFFRRSWQAVPLRPAAAPVSGPVLILADRAGVAAALQASLTVETILVEAGADFALLSAGHYRLNPGQPDDYGALLAALSADGRRPARIIHLWSYDAPAADADGFAVVGAQQAGSLSLLFLAQALARHSEWLKGLPLTVCSAGVQTVSDQEVPDWRHGALLGLLRSLAREQPGLVCRHLDLPPAGAPEEQAALILGEITTLDHPAEVAYRAGARLVPGLEALSFPEKQPLPLKHGGVYWLSGGLGGIGRLLARYLLSHWQAKLVLIGRRPADQHHDALAELARLGGALRYVAADVAVAADLQAALAGSPPPDGIFHLAGNFPTRALTEETAESFTTALKTRVDGSLALHALTPPGALFVHIASVNGVFGGAMAGAYAAANSFTAAFAQWQRQAGGVNSRCLSFSLWDEVGMSRGYLLKEQSRAQGYLPLDAGRGLNSLLIGLTRSENHLLIGLDPDRPNIRKHLRQCWPLQALTAHIVAPAATAYPPISDRYGTPCPIEIVPVAQLPVEGAAAAAAPQAAPATALQQTIAAIWREVLGLSSVGIHQNFFEIGGQSLALVQVHSRLQEALNREIQVVELLQYPTIASLAACLGEAAAPKAATFDDAMERARRQQLSRQRRRPARLDA